MLLWTTISGNRLPEIELAYLNSLNDDRVDGLIFAGGGSEDADALSRTQQALE